VLPAFCLDIAFLPSVRANISHYVIPCLRDCLMLMLASGRNATQTARSYLRAYKAPHAGLSLACPREIFTWLATGELSTK